MQISGSGDLVSRMKGAAMLDGATYESIERDTNATTQAFLVVVIASVASGIGAIRGDGGAGLIGGALGSVAAWIIFSISIYWVGTKLIPAPTTQADSGQVLRTLGFSYSPGLLAVFGFIPFLGWFAIVIAGVWTFIAGIVATRHALEMSTVRALATVLLALIPAAIVSLLISAIFGINGL